MLIEECSLNSVTVRGTPVDEVVDLAAANGFGGVGLWRDILDGEDLPRVASRIRAAGLSVSTVCRGGMFPQPTERLRAERLDDNLRAVEQTHALNARCLVLVCGPAVAGDLAEARRAIRDGVEHLAPYAAAADVDLAIEPFHPMLASSRSAVTSLREAVDLVASIGSPNVGLALDAYHVWWEDGLHQQISAAGSRIFSVQLADWLTPIDDELTSRGMPGEGSIDMAGFVSGCRSVGYGGLVEVEVLSRRWWASPAADTVRAAARAVRELDVRDSSGSTGVTSRIAGIRSPLVP